MRAKTIIKRIMESDLTKSEIDTIWNALKRKYSALSQLAVMQFAPRDYVKWTSRKGRGVMYGRVKKLNQKTVSVMASDGVEWRVSPIMLEASTESEFNMAPHDALSMM